MTTNPPVLVSPAPLPSPAPAQALTQPLALTNAEARLDHTLTSVRKYMFIGGLTVFALFGGLGGWAATTDLAGAVLAPGTVVVASNVKKVQHPTGGVVGEIFVKNGDKVRAGDMLVRLDDTVTKANLQLITKQIDELSGRLARLKAERDSSGSVAFSAELAARSAEPDVAQILTGEQMLFESRVGTRAQQKEQLGERIAGLKQEIAGNTAQATAKAKEIDLIGKELSSLEGLETRKLVTSAKMMSMRREVARLEGEKAQLQGAAGQSKGRIAEIEVQRLSIDSEARSEIVKDLRDTEGKIIELSERRTTAEDQLRRVDLKSPVDGRVHQMSVSTIGGVINTAEPLMLIVPEDDVLVIEAKIAPQDIDQARSHDEANIRFPAFNQRTTPSVAGHVLTIAADLTREPQTGQAYYVARVAIREDEKSKLAGLKLVPGMPAEVQIKTNPRSALSYLVKPLEDQFAKAFKER